MEARVPEQRLHLSHCHLCLLSSGQTSVRIVSLPRTISMPCFPEYVAHMLMLIALLMLAAVRQSSPRLVSHRIHRRMGSYTLEHLGVCLSFAELHGRIHYLGMLADCLMARNSTTDDHSSLPLPVCCSLIITSFSIAHTMSTNCMSQKDATGTTSTARTGELSLLGYSAAFHSFLGLQKRYVGDNVSIES